MTKSINIIDDVLVKSECESIINWFEKYPHKTYDGVYGRYYDGRPSKYGENKPDPGQGYVAQHVSETVVFDRSVCGLKTDNEDLNKVIDLMCSKYAREGHICRYMTVNKMYPGAKIFPHLDGFFVSDEFEVRPEMTTVVVYLNNEYHGGQLYIPNVITYEPSIGSVISFSGGQYDHGVKEVETGLRYTIVMVFDEP